MHHRRRIPYTGLEPVSTETASVGGDNHYQDYQEMGWLCMLAKCSRKSRLAILHAASRQFWPDAMIMYDSHGAATDISPRFVFQNNVIVWYAMIMLHPTAISSLWCLVMKDYGLLQHQESSLDPLLKGMQSSQVSYWNRHDARLLVLGFLHAT
jgi:hypothetical protein